jgi:transcriptional regulator with XRE-family HTH domain
MQRDMATLIWARKAAASGMARAIREGAGLSLAELAAAAAISKTAVARYESRARRPSGAAGLRYARVLSELT